MANIKSQIKRNRQNERRLQRNKSGRSFLRTKVKRFQEARQAGEGDAARDALQVVSRELDKAAGKGIIHRNKAATKKARLARRLNSSL